MDHIVDDECRPDTVPVDRPVERSDTVPVERSKVVRLERSKLGSYRVRAVCWVPVIFDGELKASSAKDAAEQTLVIAAQSPGFGFYDWRARSGIKIEMVQTVQDGPNDVPKDVTEFVPSAYRPNGPKP